MPVRCSGEEPEAGFSPAQLKVRATRSWDAWEARLRAESGFGGWSVEPDELWCGDGGLLGSIRGMTFYRIAGTAKGVPLSVEGIVAPGVTAHMTVVPVYSALDLERPSFTMDTSTTISLGRNDSQPFLSATVAPRGLPDGSTTDHAGLQVTDCTTTGAGDVKITMSVDGAEPVVIAWCSGHLSEQPRTSVALDGAEHVVELFATGPTEGATVRISQFGWREQP
jgi:hypothetical protein